MILRVSPAGSGTPGMQGQAGAQGPAGPVGPVGPTGPQGAAGQTGAQGPLGPIGMTGPQGPVGPTGATGNPGPTNIATTSTLGAVIVPGSGGLVVDGNGDLSLGQPQATAHYKATGISMTINGVTLVGIGLLPSQDLSVPGVQLGDFVIASFSAAPPSNLSLAGVQVVAVGKVRVTPALVGALTISTTTVTLNFEFSR